MHFEATEENKLIYMDIFKKYNSVIESYITQVRIRICSLLMDFSNSLKCLGAALRWKNSLSKFRKDRMR